MPGTISALGLGSGLQLQDILDQMREVDEAPIKRLESEKEQLNEQLSAFNEINQSLLSLKSAALDLSLSETYLGRSVSVTDTNVVEADVSDGAAVASYQVTVNRLATFSSWQGSGLADSTSVVNSTGSDETFSYHIGSGTVISITVPDGTTLEGLASLINEDSDNPGVTATVINDGTGTNPYRLVLKADETGESNRITIDSQLSGYTLTEIQGAGGASLNAEIVVDGITYERETNSSITDVISGVTLNLLKDGTTSVSVSTDTSAIQEKIEGLVDGFNSLIESLSEQTGYDEDGNAQLLTRSSTARTLKSELLSLISTEVDVGGSVSTMYDLGLSIDRDGKLSIDENTLANALATDLDSVKKFFVGIPEEGTDGLGDILNDELRNWTRPNTGLLTVEINSTQDKISRIDANIEATTARLDKKYDILAKQFAALDSFMSEMQSMSDYLSQQFDALTVKKQ